MQLIDNAGLWYRTYSKQALIFIVGLQVALQSVPDFWQDATLPVVHLSVKQLIAVLTFVIAVLGFIGSFVKQPELHQ